jgi:hypothetical protein
MDYHKPGLSFFGMSTVLAATRQSSISLITYLGANLPSFQTLQALLSFPTSLVELSPLSPVSCRLTVYHYLAARTSMAHSKNFDMSPFGILMTEFESDNQRPRLQATARHLQDNICQAYEPCISIPESDRSNMSSIPIFHWHLITVESSNPFPHRRGE